MKRSEFFSDECQIIKTPMKAAKVYDGKRRFMLHSFEVNAEDNLAHIIRLDYFLKLLENEEHYLSNLTLWEDPWEAKLYREFGDIYNKNRGQNMPPSFEKVLEQFSASSWSRQPDDLAMWQGYTSRVLNYRLRSVQIVTTAEELFAAFDDQTQENLTLGEIMYLSSADIMEEFAQLWPSYEKGFLLKSNNMVLYPLFIKRQDFAHENEVRLVYQNPSNDLTSEETGKAVTGKSLKILHMDKFIHKIILDPWCSQAEANSIESYVSKIVQRHWPSWKLSIEQSKVSLNN